MAPQSRAQLARGRALKREQLMTAATRAFARHGFVGATTKRLAREAGVSEGLLYHYFPSKRRLLAAIRDRVFADVHAALARGRPSSAISHAEHVIRGVLESFRVHRDFWRLALFNRGNAVVRATIDTKMAEAAAELQRALERALARDGARKPAIEAELLFATIEGVTTRFVRDDGYPLEAVTEALVRSLASTD
jgi:AcrR family transcriptional regulator